MNKSFQCNISNHVLQCYHCYAVHNNRNSVDNTTCINCTLRSINFKHTQYDGLYAQFVPVGHTITEMHCTAQVCGNDLLAPIPSHSCSYSHSHSRFPFPRDSHGKNEQCEVRFPTHTSINCRQLACSSGGRHSRSCRSNRTLQQRPDVPSSHGQNQTARWL